MILLMKIGRIGKGDKMIDQEIVVQNQAKTYTRSVDSKRQRYGTGRGKRDAVAKVWASYSSAGNKIKINNKLLMSILAILV